jgi:antitoxin (DNA-binding transcriptional repressor) of toxin-antitoxin stability system
MGVILFNDLTGKLAELARRVEAGETIVVIREGKPVLDLVPHRPSGRLDFEAGATFLRAKGITNPVPYISDDFDEPLPADLSPPARL